jgi:23S rRNA (cytosine1962-C5)-methyltransferase
MTAHLLPPLRVRERGAARLSAGHPWVYRSDLIAPPAAAGFAAIHDPRGRPLGWAAVHPRSQIAVRLMRREDVAIDDAFVLARVSAALDLREQLQRDPDAQMAQVTGYRLVHADADGLPGLIVDRLGPVLVLQNGCAALEPLLPAIVGLLMARLTPEGIFGRLDSAVRDLEGLPREKRVLAGDVPERVPVVDGVLSWSVDPRGGQKTGAYLDQRLNHQRFARAVACYQPGARVLDVFAHHGGFGLHALHAGAAHATLIDSSAEALQAALATAARHQLPTPSLRRGDAFALLRELEREGAQFDAISVDPPALAGRARDVERALAGYKELNLRALQLLAPNGLLVSSSCSAQLQEADLMNVLSEAAADAAGPGGVGRGRELRVLWRAGASPDHPERLTFPESAYLNVVLVQARP